LEIITPVKRCARVNSTAEDAAAGPLRAPDQALPRANASRKDCVRIAAAASRNRCETDIGRSTSLAGGGSL
jgi:hypothetical protein